MTLGNHIVMIEISMVGCHDICQGQIIKQVIEQTYKS